MALLLLTLSIRDPRLTSKLCGLIKCWCFLTQCLKTGLTTGVSCARRPCMHASTHNGHWTEQAVGSRGVLEMRRVGLRTSLPSVLRLVAVASPSRGSWVSGRREGIELTWERLDRDLMSSFCSGCLSFSL